MIVKERGGRGLVAVKRQATKSEGERAQMTRCTCG